MSVGVQSNEKMQDVPMMTPRIPTAPQSEKVRAYGHLKVIGYRREVVTEADPC